MRNTRTKKILCTPFPPLHSNIVHVGLVRYGESELAVTFATQWRPAPFTRIAANYSATVPGGMADSNNALEATNKAHKVWASFAKLHGAAYAKALAK